MPGPRRRVTISRHAHARGSVSGMRTHRRRASVALHRAQRPARQQRELQEQAAGKRGGEATKGWHARGLRYFGSVVKTTDGAKQGCRVIAFGTSGLP
jgi:hypothetical protein